MNPRHDPLSSRELLARIGLGEDAPVNLLADEPLMDLAGDLAAVLRERYRLPTRPHRFAPASW
jgi:hypothetical protein